MKWLLDRIGRRLIAAQSQKPASGDEPITPADPHQTDLVPNLEPRRLSERVEVNVDAKRKELGVEDALKDIPGVTAPMGVPRHSSQTRPQYPFVITITNVHAGRWRALI